VTTSLPPSTRTTRDSLHRSLLILTVALLFLGAGLAVADGDTAVGTPVRPQTSVEGTVTAVSGNLVTLFDNAFVIDTTGARIVLGGDEGANDAVPAITVGARILAEGLTPEPVARPGFPPLKATLVIVTPPLNGAASGAIESVNVVGSFFSLLSHNFLVNGNTRFTGEVKSLADLAQGQLAFVTFSANGPTPLALTVNARNVPPDQFVSFRGAVVSIPSPPPLGMWQIDDKSVMVTADTRIVGDPKVGDVVDVLAKWHNPPPGSEMPTFLEAVFIVKAGIPPPPPPTHEIDFTGKVESIPSPPPLGHWKIGGKDVLVNGLTRITGSPAVGDTVEVNGFIQPPTSLMPSTAAGQIVATSIQKKSGG
jgi:hypothetical protein